jgi:hypothetical protein
LYRTVAILKRALYAQAAVWAVAGVVLAVAPRWVLTTLFDQPPLAENAWLRILGVEAAGLAMLMVLVARRLDDLWWWAWAFELVTLCVASVAALNAAFGLSPHEPALLWWLLTAAAVVLALALLVGLAGAARDNPP